ncbi:MAG: nitroreductase family protein [Bacillota bacterium]
MKFTRLIEEMRTIRDYKKELVNPDFIKEVLDSGTIAKGFWKDTQTSIRLIENGKEMYDELSGKAGYNGKMIEAPHYLVISSKVSPGHIESGGYIMEWMRLKAWELGLGTCWLSVENTETLHKKLNLGNDEVITAFASIGYPYTGIFKKDLSHTSSRLGIEDIISLETWGKPCSIEYLNTRGMTNIFYYARLAPSWRNKQPWHFIIDNDKILLIMNQMEKENMLVDAGIIMLYFEKAAHEEGILGSWKLETSDDMIHQYAIPHTHYLIGYYQI